MYLQAVTNKHRVDEQPWVGIPAIDDVLECPNCGWKGDNSELVVSGFDTDIVDQVVSGECSLECPDCRADAGHMLYGWSIAEKITYCEDDLPIAKKATNILAHSLGNIYQLPLFYDKQPVSTSNEFRNKRFERRRNRFAQKKNLMREPIDCGLKVAGLCG